MFFVYPQLARSEASPYFIDFVVVAKRQPGRKDKIVSNDGAKELNSEECTSSLKFRGIMRELSEANAHEQMGLTECRNRTLQEKGNKHASGCQTPAKSLDGIYRH